MTTLPADELVERRATIPERCASTEHTETAAQIVADVRSKMDEASLSLAMDTFKRFSASWEGSIIVAIGTYLEGAPSADALSTQAATIEAQAAEISSLRAKLAEAMEWIGYWLDGDEIIQSCLARCQTGNPEYAPFPLVGDEAVSWLAAQADAYQNALEMMGVPSASGPKIRAARRLIEGNGK